MTARKRPQKSAYAKKKHIPASHEIISMSGNVTKGASVGMEGLGIVSNKQKHVKTIGYLGNAPPRNVRVKNDPNAGLTPKGTPPSAYIPPDDPRSKLVDKWKDWGLKAKIAAKNALSPQGISSAAKKTGGLAKRAGKFVVAQANKSMEDAVRYDEARRIRDHDSNREKIERWNALDEDERKSILKEQQDKAKMRIELQHFRQGMEDYQMDKNEAALTGRKFRPAIFKKPGGLFGEDEGCIDEYGRDVPCDRVEPSSKSSRSRRTENEDVHSLLGIKRSQFRPTSQPRFREPEDDDVEESSPSPLEIMGASPRRRVSREERAMMRQQPQQPQLTEGSQAPVRKRRTFHSEEARELNQFRSNEGAVLKQLLDGF